MKRLLVWISALAAVSGSVLFAQDLTGTWQGTLMAGKPLRIVMKISRADDGLKAVMHSIDQGGQGIAASAITVQGASIKIAVAGIAGTYEGRLLESTKAPAEVLVIDGVEKPSEN